MDWPWKDGQHGTTKQAREAVSYKCILMMMSSSHSRILWNCHCCCGSGLITGCLQLWIGNEERRANFKSELMKDYSFVIEVIELLIEIATSITNLVIPFEIVLQRRLVLLVMALQNIAKWAITDSSGQLISTAETQGMSVVRLCSLVFSQAHVTA